jgi:hypothetical protein
MQVLQQSISPRARQMIQDLYEIHGETLLESTKDRIGYVNVYHHSWPDNPYQTLVEEFANEFGLDLTKIASFGFLNAPVGCNDQFFHIDYEGKTETCFVPLVDINNDMGTQYVLFPATDKTVGNDHEKLFELFLTLSNKYNDPEELSKQFEMHGIKRDEFYFCQVQTQAYSLVYLPYDVMHRGVCNRSGRERPMFQLVMLRDESYPLCKSQVIPDAELDEAENIFELVKTQRSI